jgi:DegV family protein with EDD domain
MPRIAVVTDSTCDLGPKALADKGVAMVPLKVHFGDETFQDWVDLTPKDFYDRLRVAAQLPTTSQPTPGDFAETYKRLASEGAEGIVSVHLSAKLSGTVESAVMAASTAPVPVRVVDTTFVSGAMAFAIDAACEARDAGGYLDSVEKAAASTIDKTELFFVLDTLDYLVKGGRAGRAQGMAASLLNIKPVLQVTGGVIEPFKKSKGTNRAIREMAEHVAARSKKLGPLKIVVIHAVATNLADELANAIRSAGTDIASLAYDEIGACIGTHVGPRALGVGYMPAE